MIWLGVLLPHNQNTERMIIIEDRHKDSGIGDDAERGRSYEDSYR